MSFAKARLQRFNEIQDCSPSPAKYNVAENHNKFIRCGLFTKSGKFSRKVGAVGSPTGSEASSTQSTPCFQTPTAVPKKKKTLSNYLSSKSKSHDHELLKEKTVECNNKDVYIKELIDELENLKIKICDLDEEKTVINSENQKLKELTENLQHEQNKNLEILTLKCHKIEEIDEELRQIHTDYHELKSRNSEDMQDMLNNLNKFEIIYNESVEESKKLLTEKDKQFQEILASLKQEHNQEIELWMENSKRDNEAISWKNAEMENLRREHTKELDTVIAKCQKESEIILSEMQEIENSKSEAIEEIRAQLSQKDAKIILLEENFIEVSLLTEMQTKEKCDEIEKAWQLKLEEQQKISNAILKECQEISEYNIIQSEIEKNNIKKELENIQGKFSELNIKYDDLNKAAMEISNLKSQKHAYEITINTNLETIEVLKKRLINSDRDVEQFKEELYRCEAKLLNLENRNQEFILQIEELHNEKEELEMQFESTLKITETEVQNTMKALINKVENYDEIVKKQIIKYQKDQQLFREVFTQLQQQQILNNQAQNVIDQSKCMLENLESNNNTLQSKNLELESELEIYRKQIDLYNREVEEAAEIRKKYIETSGKYDEILQKHEQILLEIEKLKYEKGKLESKNTEMRAKIEQLHLKIQTFDIELESLEIKKSCLELENRELGQKYGDLLGHHNNKQKIKHINELKKDYGELYKHNIDLKLENTNLSKIVERLNKELSEMKKAKKIKRVEDKENVASPTRLFSRLDSPGPLKEKN